MEYGFHPFHELFKQLGLECDAAAIGKFLRTHAPIPPAVTLPDAPFWSLAQAAFLRDALSADSDWAEVVDALNAALRLESA